MRTSKAKKLGRPVEVDRDKIMDAAQPLFSKQGFHGTSTREIAKLAKCNVAMISYYFGSKKGLYEAIFFRYFEASRLRFIESRATHISDAELVKAWPELKKSVQRRFCSTLYELSLIIVANTEIRRLMVREMCSGESLINLTKAEIGFWGPFRAYLEELIKEGELSGELDPRISIVCLVGPIIYSTIGGELLKKMYGLNYSDRSYVRKVCLQLTRMFFSGYVP